MDDSLKVVKVEHHAWHTCPCVRCVMERNERSETTVKTHRRLAVGAAHILGFFSRRCDSGSLARDEMNKQERK
jgi:hypothetical protein